MMLQLLSVSSALLLLSGGGLAVSVDISVKFENGQYVVTNSIDTEADAYGFYDANYNSSGWGYLDAHIKAKVESTVEHFAYAKSLGYLEGYATCDTLKTFYPNFYSAVFGSSSAPGVETVTFVEDNYNWMVAQAEANYMSNDLWYSVKLMLNQLDGMLQGLREGCPSTYASSNVDYTTLDNPTLTHLLLLNAWGDLYQITMKYLEPGHAKGLRRGDSGGPSHRRDLRESSAFVERCSAIIKLLPNYADVVYGHATWDSFESLGPRIFKHMSYPLRTANGITQPYDVYFSSSPGLLSSVDDFFTVSGFSQLGVLETTNDLLNISLLSEVKPESLLSYMRAVVANQVAKDGHDWAELFSQYASGTYTNQWMVLNLNKFTPFKSPERGFLTILEEVPGRIHWDDMSDFLGRNNYWPSYNNPYFKDIHMLSGYSAACALSDDWCYDTAPRANIFRDRQSMIQNEQGVQDILGYNDFQNDPLSENDSCNAIACRGDLEPNERTRGPYGALDAKVTSVLDSLRAPGTPPVILARMGPTTDQQEPFCWSQLSAEEDKQYSHNGQPDCFDFAWQSIVPPEPTAA